MSRLTKESGVIAQDFRAIIRSLTSDGTKPIASLIHELFDSYAEADKTSTTKLYLTQELFDSAAHQIKQIRQKFSRPDLEELFDSIDESQSGKIEIDQLIMFCERSVSKGRIYALKSRNAIIGEFRNETEFRNKFASLVNAPSVFADNKEFIFFIEDMLETNIEEADAVEVLSFYDIDHDGKISVEDFVGFLTGKTVEATRALESFNGQSIVDIRISYNVAQYTSYLETGYTQILPDVTSTGGLQNNIQLAAEGTFGKGQSMWIWRRHQGTFGGRLKSVIDIQLDGNSCSSSLVLSGYTCIPNQVSGQYVWIKRAMSDEDEKDAIIDLRVSVGKMKIPTDKIWINPGVGWIRVDGNFSKGLFSWTDSFLWFRPLRTRSADSHLSSPIRSVVSLSDEERNTKLSVALRMALRHYIPQGEMKKFAISKQRADSYANSAQQGSNNRGGYPPEAIGTKKYEYSALFHQYDLSKKGRLTSRQLQRLMFDCGLNFERADINRCFRFFNISVDKITISIDSYISRDEYVFLLCLTDYEIDLALDLVKDRLLSAAYSVTARPKPAFENGSASNLVSVSMNDVGSETSQPIKSGTSIGTIIPPTKKGLRSNKLRENRVISQIFQTINTKTDNILSLEEMTDLLVKLEIYMTEEEIAKMMRLMDLDGDDRIEESDFLSVMNSPSTVIQKKALRVREATATIRRWLQRGCATGTAPIKRTERIQAWMMNSTVPIPTPQTITYAQWNNFKRMHEQSARARFPGFVSSDDLLVVLASLGVHLTSCESREVALLIAPDKNGRIQETEFNAFVSRNCRTAGELVAILERTLMKSAIEAFKTFSSATRSDGVEDPELLEAFRAIVKSIIADIQRLAATTSSNNNNSSNNNTNNNANSATITHDVVSISQLKLGIESAMKDAKPEQQALFPNLEEWAYISCLVGADVAEEDTYGVRVQSFIRGVCEFAVGGSMIANEGLVTLEMVCKDLQRMIRDEAKLHGKGGRPDYTATFRLFDVDENDHISTIEFKNMLIRLRLADSLPDAQMPKLIEKFDKKNKGYIAFEDFIGFIESHKDLLNEDDYDDSNVVFDTADEDKTLALKSSVPPAAVTRDADCDWLLWHLWRRANKIDAADPEAVISELENSCAEAELIQQRGNVTVGELWDIFHDLKLMGDLARPQYEKGLKYLLMEGTGKDSDEVDYESLCRYTIRMGRAYNEMMQESLIVDEKKYKELKTELKKELVAYGMVVGSRGEKIYKFDKVFRRVDSDGDGQVTMQELKSGMKKIKLKGEKFWSLKMLRRMFYEVDKDHSGTISLKEFSEFVQNPNNDEVLRYDPTTDKLSTGISKPPLGKDQRDKLNRADSDDDDFADFRGGTGGINDVELYRKVTDILRQVIPIKAGFSPEHHMDEIKTSIRKFFQKSDAENRGLVTEEKFKSLLRQTKLQDSLSVGECRRLIDKLRRRQGTGNVRGGGMLIDYERFLRTLSANPSTIPHSKGEAVLLNLQEACIASAQRGKTFLSLCSFVDYQQDGFLTPEELIHTSKMMGCPLSSQNIDALREILPDSCFDNRGSFDYKELHYYIQSFTPRSNFNLDLTEVMRPTPGLSSGQWDHRGATTIDRGRIAQSLDFGSARKSIRQAIATPSNSLGRSANLRSPLVNDKILQTIKDRISIVLLDRTKGGFGEDDGVISLQRIFQRKDYDGYGYVSLQNFRGIVEDLGVPLSTSDVQTIVTTFGRPEDESINYDNFCRMLISDNDSRDLRDTSLRGSSTEPLTVYKGRYGSETVNRNRDRDRDEAVSYTNQSVIERYRELQEEGRDPRDLFEIHDRGLRGVIDVRKFRDVIDRTQLFETNHQLFRAIDDFTVPSDKSLVAYDEFCRTIEAKAAVNSPLRKSRGRGDLSVRVNDDDDDNVIRESWYGDGLSRSQQVRRMRDIPNDLDEGSVDRNDDVYYPKVSDSLRFNRTTSPRKLNNRYDDGLDTRFSDRDLGASRRLSPTRYGSSNAGRASQEYSSGVKTARVSPSKVGVKMWGPNVPVDRVGVPPNLDRNSWTCRVCMYVENPVSREKCGICESPNYQASKKYQLKEQCPSCQFQNGHLADKCEMCNTRLSTAYRR